MTGTFFHIQRVETIVNDTVEISTNPTTAIEEISQIIQDLMNVAGDIEEMAKDIYRTSTTEYRENIEWKKGEVWKKC